MTIFEPGDEVVITHPVSPDRHPAGTCADVTMLGTGDQQGLVGIVVRGGGYSVVWAHELSPAD
ncbi:hypothetical protein ACFCX4_09020 [Kitasatospora sp. NPDC056327]|uniref:hypothetical protein n=1 Tax=Kitasatospora sp. NPDC056327 TaxID=3345785 RepID=UPI0035DE2BEC